MVALVDQASRLRARMEAEKRDAAHLAMINDPEFGAMASRICFMLRRRRFSDQAASDAREVVRTERPEWVSAMDFVITECVTHNSMTE